MSEPLTPIDQSLCCIFRKYLNEFANHVIDFLDESNILNDNQFGFRRNYSTCHAIICLVEKMAKASDKEKIVVGLMIDLKKAFDRICHKTLLKKLFTYSTRRKVLTGLQSYK